MRYDNVTGMQTTVKDYLFPALPFALVIILLFIYLRGMLRAYRAAADGWKSMDHDVRVVFLLAVPLFRGGIKTFMLADRLFYRPKAEFVKGRAR